MSMTSHRDEKRARRNVSEKKTNRPKHGTFFPVCISPYLSVVKMPRRSDLNPFLGLYLWRN